MTVIFFFLFCWYSQQLIELRLCAPRPQCTHGCGEVELRFHYNLRCFFFLPSSRLDNSAILICFRQKLGREELPRKTGLGKDMRFRGDWLPHRRVSPGDRCPQGSAGLP